MLVAHSLFFSLEHLECDYELKDAEMLMLMIILRIINCEKLWCIVDIENEKFREWEEMTIDEEFDCVIWYVLILFTCYLNFYFLSIHLFIFSQYVWENYFY
jgi:hypothetical protein